EEHLLERLELLGGMLVLVGAGAGGEEEEQGKQGACRDPQPSVGLHGSFSFRAYRAPPEVDPDGSTSASRGCRTWLRLSPHPESTVALAKTSLRHIMYWFSTLAPESNRSADQPTPSKGSPGSTRTMHLVSLGTPSGAYGQGQEVASMPMDRILPISW